MFVSRSQFSFIVVPAFNDRRRSRPISGSTWHVKQVPPDRRLNPAVAFVHSNGRGSAAWR